MSDPKPRHAWPPGWLSNLSRVSNPVFFLIFLFPPVPGHHHSAVVHWSRWRALVILLLSTLCMSACADLATEHISPILTNSTISQVSVGTVASLVWVALRIVDGSSSPGTCPKIPMRLGEKMMRCSMCWGDVVAQGLGIIRIRPCTDPFFFLQYFIGVTVLAMVPELPEIVNGIQFALQNNLSLR